MTMTPVVDFHLEAETDACICQRLVGCGGIPSARVDCPEHGFTAAGAYFHTHAKQVDRVIRGRWVP